MTTPCRDHARPRPPPAGRSGPLEGFPPRGGFAPRGAPATHHRWAAGSGTVRLMVATYGVAAAAAALLVISGVAKLMAPASATAALRSVGVTMPAAGRLLGLGELALAGWFLLVGGAAATLALGVGYLGFSVFVGWGRRSGRLADCGCFGGPAATPPTRLHAAVTGMLAVVVLASAAAALAGTEVPALATALSRTPWHGVPVLAGVLLLTWLLHLCLSVLTAMPSVGAALRPDSGPRLFSLTVPPLGAGAGGTA